MVLQPQTVKRDQMAITLRWQLGDAGSSTVDRSGRQGLPSLTCLTDIHVVHESTIDSITLPQIEAESDHRLVFGQAWGSSGVTTAPAGWRAVEPRPPGTGSADLSGRLAFPEGSHYPVLCQADEPSVALCRLTSACSYSLGSTPSLTWRTY